MRILIAEDDPICQKTLQSALNGYGGCSLASDGAQAFEMFKEALDADDPFSLVCLDVMMPKRSGLEVLVLIREYERTKGVPVEQAAHILMTTGLEDELTFMQAHQAGSTWYITKPIDRSRVRAVLEDLGFARAM